MSFFPLTAYIVVYGDTYLVNYAKYWSVWSTNVRTALYLDKELAVSIAERVGGHIRLVLALS